MAPMASSRYSDMSEFFAPDVFQAVLQDPATAVRLKSFCEASACGENIAFLEKVDQYSQLLNQAQDLLLEIHATYTSPNATEPINITESLSKGLTSAINTTTKITFPAMQDIFLDAREHTEDLIREDIYPRFVTHQMTASAIKALSQDRNTFQGLGDCFCLTDPNIADNAIVCASDGFVDVTGYSRRDIVPRNCRFLQGPKTDRSTVTRLKSSINNGEESVELLLNYRKDGSPFWNLLYVAPLRDEAGNIVFFLGGQINCSTTIHSNPDLLRILEFDGRKPLPPRYDDLAVKNGSSMNDPSSKEILRRHRALFRSTSHSMIEVRQGAGMEDDMINKIGHMSRKAQMETFQTAYSKYLVLKVKTDTRAKFSIAHYSKSAADLLYRNRMQGVMEPIVNEDVFKVLSERSPSPSYVSKSYKKAVTDYLAEGKAVSVKLEVLVQDKGSSPEARWPVAKIVQDFVTHWTPCKDEEGRAKYVVLVFAEV